MKLIRDEVLQTAENFYNQYNQYAGEYMMRFHEGCIFNGVYVFQGETKPKPEQVISYIYKELPK